MVAEDRATRFRVALIGASGKVGRQCVQHLLLNSRDPNWDLILTGNSNERLLGLVADATSAVTLARREGAALPRIVTSAAPSALRECDLIAIVAGEWPSAEKAAEFRRGDPSGRLVQSHANLALIRRLGRSITEHAPSASVIVVTNQSDLMTLAMRDILPPARVLGFGGIVDSARFRTLAKAFAAQAGARNAHMIGYHNSDMMLLTSSLEHDLSAADLGALVTDTREYGQRLSRLQQHPSRSDQDSGASLLPGYALYQTIAAFLGQSDAVEESFNVVLCERAAILYGTRMGVGLSVPVRIERGGWETILDHTVTESERVALGEAQQRVELAYRTLLSGSEASR